MKRVLLISLLSMLSAGCNDAATERYVQFDDQTSQWRAIEVGADSVAWISSEQCEREFVESKDKAREELRHFEIETVDGVEVYSHPSIGEFIHVASYDHEPLEAARELGNKHGFWKAQTDLPVTKC
ncbi:MULTISPECIES: hypothetical protein [Aeromonas]|uniref:hypothetical protein n=1 Tax=Aeromonas TaxID=642 RepID=UPI002B05C83F|nr:hypothetical protein [Aeromonas jandaei]